MITFTSTVSVSADLSLLQFVALLIRASQSDAPLPEIVPQIGESAATLLSQGSSEAELQLLEASMRQVIQNQAIEDVQPLTVFVQQANEAFRKSDIYSTLAKEACPEGGRLPSRVPLHLEVKSELGELALFQRYGAYIHAAQFMLPSRVSLSLFLLVNSVAQAILAYGVDKYSQKHGYSPRQAQQLQKALAPFVSLVSNFATLGMEWASKYWLFNVQIPSLSASYHQSVPQLVRDEAHDQITVSVLSTKFASKGDFIHLIQDPKTPIETLATKENITVEDLKRQSGQYAVQVNLRSEAPVFLIDSLESAQQCFAYKVIHPFTGTPHQEIGYYILEWNEPSQELTLAPMPPVHYVVADG